VTYWNGLEHTNRQITTRQGSGTVPEDVEDDEKTKKSKKKRGQQQLPGAIGLSQSGSRVRFTEDKSTSASVLSFGLSRSV